MKMFGFINLSFFTQIFRMYTCNPNTLKTWNTFLVFADCSSGLLHSWRIFPGKLTCIVNIMKHALIAFKLLFPYAYNHQFVSDLAIIVMDRKLSTQKNASNLLTIHKSSYPELVTLISRWVSSLYSINYECTTQRLLIWSEAASLTKIAWRWIYKFVWQDEKSPLIWSTHQLIYHTSHKMKSQRPWVWQMIIQWVHINHLDYIWILLHIRSWYYFGMYLL